MIKTIYEKKQDNFTLFVEVEQLRPFEPVVAIYSKEYKMTYIFYLDIKEFKEMAVNMLSYCEQNLKED